MDWKLPKSRIVGTKQTLRALKDGIAKKVYIARDADINIVSSIVNMAKQSNVEIVYVDDMEELGRLCSIEVNAAAACLVND